MIKKIFHSPSCETCKYRIDTIFHDLNESEASEISIQKSCNYYSKGDTIFKEGNQPDGLYCISGGKVKVSQTGPEGKEQIIKLAKEGDIMGYRSLISGENYSVTATAIDDSKVCIIPKTVFFELVRTNPRITKNVMKLLATELKEAENKITNIAQKPVIERLAEALLMLKDFYGRDAKDSEDNFMNIFITRQELANIVGTATETAIRLLSELRKEGILELDGKRIKILKNQSLVKLANLTD